MNRKLKGGSFIAAGLVTCAAFGFAAFNPSVVRDGKKSFDTNNSKGSIAANASSNVLADGSDITYMASSKTLKLNGNSVVIKKTTTEGSDGVNVFLDADHDGKADNAVPIMYDDADGNPTADFPAGVSIYGISGYEKDVFDGDLTIYMESGQVNTIYGVQTGVKEVTGKVGVYISDGKVTEDVVAAYGIKAPVVECKVTGGEIGYKFNGVIAAYNCNEVGEVNLEITGDKCITGNTSTNYDSTRAKATYTGSVKGDVNIKIGAKEGENIFGTNGGFVGVNSTKVEGNVNCEFVGDAISNNFVNMISNRSTVTGDLIVNWKKGNVSSSNRNNPQQWGLVSEGSKVRNVIVRAADGANLETESYITLYKSTVDNIDIDLSNATTYYRNTYDYYMLSHYNCTINNSGIIRYNDPYGRKVCYLFGEYTFKKNMEVTQCFAYGANANITVDKGVTVRVIKNGIDSGSIGSEGNFTNNGVLDLEGTFSTTGAAKLTNNGQINAAGSMQFALNGGLINNGTINVDGNFTTSGAQMVNNGDLIVGGKANFNYANNSEYTEVTNSKGAYLGIAGKSKISGLSFINKGELNLGMNSSNKYNIEVTYLNNKENLGKIVNYGKIFGSVGFSLGSESTCDNYGEIDLSQANCNHNGVQLNYDAYLINREGATLKFKSDIYNLGYIYNYGKCIQKGKGNSLGTIICVKNIDFELSGESILANNENHIFYPVAFSYPDAIKKITTVAIEIGVRVDESDETLYAEFGKYVSVKVSEMADGYTFADIESVAFVGSDDVFDASEDNIFSGLMPANKAEIVINVKSSDGKQITLDTNEINVAPLKVGVDAGTVYDLTTIKISNDGNTGTVKYVESALNPLPEGLEVVDGKIVGTPEKAYEEGFEAKVVITGKNLTRASVTVKFEKINKGTPTYTTPRVTGYEGDTLGRVRVSSVNKGSYGWEEDLNAVLDSEYNESVGYTLYFYPSDADNYDWSVIKVGEWDVENARLVTKVKINIRKKNSDPIIVVEDKLYATYGDLLSAVKLPSVDGGKLEWNYDELPDGKNTKVGDATDLDGRTFVAKFVPDNGGNEQIVDVVIIVGKLKVEVPLTYEFAANAGDILADVELPKVDGGVFAFADETTTKVESKDYDVIFTPNDVKNIEWVLTDEAVAHDAVVNENGSISYKATITVAKEDTKEEPKIDDKKDEVAKQGKKDNKAKASKNVNGPKVGTKLTFKNYIYKVTKAGTKDGKVVGEVSVVGHKKKSVKSVKIADSVKIDGVKYNVTSIGKKAFKNKKVKKVTIGKNVKTIGTNAFAGNKKLKKVTIKSNVISKIGKKAFFRKGGKKLVVKVPKKLKKKYKKLLKVAKTKKYIVK